MCLASFSEFDARPLESSRKSLVLGFVFISGFLSMFTRGRFALFLLRRSVWVCCFLFFVQRNFLFVVVEVAYAMARFQF